MSLEIDCLKLIAAVRERTPLYDLNTREHNDRVHKKQLWIEVCKEVFTPAVWESLSVDAQGRNEIEVQKRWINLRHCFRRDVKKQKSLPPEERDRKRRKYIYSDELAFILPFLKNENESEPSEPRAYGDDVVIDANKLIPAVKTRPPIYDATMKEYSDLDLKKTLWDEVCREVFTPTAWESLSEKEQASHLHEVRKKWVNLRHCFRRDIMTQIKMESEGKKKKRKYIYYDELSFLLPFYTHNESETIYLENDAAASADSSTDVSDNEEGRKEKYSTFPEDTDDSQNPLSQDSEKEKESSDELFLRSLVPYVNEIPEDKKLQFRIEIIKLFLNFKQSLQYGPVLSNIQSLKLKHSTD
ncbi:uncharacterized protein LOC121729634 [Aricia agestis]|uniref:uncharacterized protein LOC121729634 n=1 Tax=Aricia agestis TaxID=91739 RepID=UPI001C20593D|nr:uncharacterized protein LOC121729634 [Aricia agestis]